MKDLPTILAPIYTAHLMISGGRKPILASFMGLIAVVPLSIVLCCMRILGRRIANMLIS